jgi:hypothetical protein
MTSVTSSASRLAPSDRRALIVGAIAVGVMLSYTWIARPVVIGILARREVLTQQRGLLSREKALLATAPALPAARRIATRRLKETGTRLLTGDSVAATSALASVVADIAAATGVRVVSVEGRPPVSRAGLTTVLVELRGEARWDQVLGFIRTLEGTGTLIDVASLRIERGLPGSGLVNLTASLAGVAMEQP